jgi:hypothetical protein
MIEEIRGKLTLSVPEAGRIIYDIGRDAAYAAVERGEIPVRRLGRKLRVPTHLALRDVGVSEEQIACILGGRVAGDRDEVALALGRAT